MLWPGLGSERAVRVASASPWQRVPQSQVVTDMRRCTGKDVLLSGLDLVTDEA